MPPESPYPLKRAALFLSVLLCVAGCGPSGEHDRETRPPASTSEPSPEHEQSESQPTTASAPASETAQSHPAFVLKRGDEYPILARLRGTWKPGAVEMTFTGLLGDEVTVRYPDGTIKTGWLRVESPCRVAVLLKEPSVRFQYALALTPERVYLGRGEVGIRLPDGRFYVEIPEGVLLKSGEKECQFYRNAVGGLVREPQTVACEISTRPKIIKRTGRNSPQETPPPAPEEETIFTYAIPQGGKARKGTLFLLGDALVSEELQQSSAEFVPSSLPTSGSAPSE